MATMAIPISSNYDEKMVEFLEDISNYTNVLTKQEDKQIKLLKKGGRKSEGIDAILSGYTQEFKDANKGVIETLLQRQEEENKRNDVQTKLENNLEKLKIQRESAFTNYQRKHLDKQIEYAEIEQKYNERNEQISKMQQEGKLTSKEAARLSFQDKINKVYDKFLIKGKFFKNVLGNLKDIAKGVWDSAEGWIFKLLKLLFVLAIFDPDGKFLTSIMDFLTKALIWVIELLAKMLPRIVKTFVFLLTKVLPKALIKMIAALFPAIGGMFDTFAKSIEKDYPAIAWMFKKIGEMFKKDGLLYNFFTFLAKNLPLIVGLFVGVRIAKFFSFLGPIGKGLGFIVNSIFPKLIPAIASLGKAFLVALGPIALIVTAIAGLAFAFYKISEESVKKYNVFNKEREKIRKNNDILGELNLYKKEREKWFGALHGERWKAAKEAVDYKKDTALSATVKGVKAYFDVMSEQNNRFIDLKEKLGEPIKLKDMSITMAFELLKRGVNNFGKSIIGAFSSALQFSKNMANDIWNMGKKSGKGISKFFIKTLPDFFSKKVGPSMVSKLKGTWENVKSSSLGKKVGGVINTAKEYGGRAIDFVINQLDRFGKWLRDSFFGTLQSIFDWFSAIAISPTAYLQSIILKTDYARKAQLITEFKSQAKLLKESGKKLEGDSQIVKIINSGRDLTEQDIKNNNLTEKQLEALIELTKKGLDQKGNKVIVTKNYIDAQVRRHPQ